MIPETTSLEEAKKYMEQIRKFLLQDPEDDLLLIFVGSILWAASGLLLFKGGEIFPNPDIVGGSSVHGIAPLALHIKIFRP